MELSYNELRKREVINLSDGRSLGRITNLYLDFPKGILVGISVQGKKTCKVISCIKLFNKNEIYIPEKNIIKIGNDVILVELKCGDFCGDSVKISKQNPKHKNECCLPASFDMNKSFCDDDDNLDC